MLVRSSLLCDVMVTEPSMWNICNEVLSLRASHSGFILQVIYYKIQYSIQHMTGQSQAHRCNGDRSLTIIDSLFYLNC